MKVYLFQNQYDAFAKAFGWTEKPSYIEIIPRLPANGSSDA